MLIKSGQTLILAAFFIFFPLCSNGETPSQQYSGQSEYSSPSLRNWQLHEAAQSGNLEVVTRIIEENPMAVNARETFTGYGNTPLHFAARFGRKAVAEFLLSKAADANLPDCQGWTPLHLAAFGGFRDIVELLLAKGADINFIGASGTPLHVAIMGEKSDTYELLVLKGAKFNLKYGDQQWTPLHQATYGNQIKAVRFLAGKGADLLARDADGMTPYDLASQLGFRDVADFLEEKGGNPPDAEPSSNASSSTAS